MHAPIRQDKQVNSGSAIRACPEDIDRRRYVHREGSGRRPPRAIRGDVARAEAMGRASREPETESDTCRPSSLPPVESLT